jgi:hypothetical protein
MSHPIAESLRRWVPRTDGPDTLKFTGAEEIERQAAEIVTLKQAVAEAWEQGRESLALDFAKPLSADGFRSSTPNPYRT